MNHKLILYLPARSKILVYAQIVWVMIMLWLRDVVGLPSMVTYVTDIILIGVLVLNANRIRHNVRYANVETQSRILMIMLGCIIIGIILNLVNPLLVAWAVRNNFRFFAFFYVCIGVLDSRDVDKILLLLRKFFWANVVLCTYQHFVLGLEGDQLGGFFGVVEGCNAFMNILLCGIASHIVAEYSQQKINMSKLAGHFAGLIYVAVLSELKMFYFEVVIIIVVVVLCVRPSMKNVLLVIMSLLSLGLLLVILAKIDPYSLTVLLDEDALIRYLASDGYTNSGDINRLTAFSQIFSRFFKGDPIRTIFGFGFGNCETSQFEILNSDFFGRYGYLNYRWFTHSWVYIEQGLAGIVLLFTFFTSLFLFSIKGLKNARKDLAMTAVIFTSLCFANIVYNCSLQIEACYMMAFMVAIPFILQKEKNVNEYTRKVYSSKRSHNV